MKYFSKILFIFVLIILLSSFVFPVNAAETISFKAGNTGAKNNRIFSIPISGSGYETLSAVKFVFEYDNNSIEYRKINVADKSSIVKEADENGKLSLIFLNEKGINLSNTKQLFTIDFKAENLNKNIEIKFSVSDCVNSSVQSVNATGGNCVVTYLGDAPEDEEDSDNKSSGRTNANGNSGNSYSEDGEYENSGENNGYEDYGDQENINSQNGENDQNYQYDEQGNLIKVDESDNTLKIFLSGAVIVIVLAVICCVLYHLGRKSRENENKDKLLNSDSTENSNENEDINEQQNENEEKPLN